MTANAAKGEDAISESWEVTLSYLPTTLQLSTENRHKTVLKNWTLQKCVYNDYQDV